MPQGAKAAQLRSGTTSTGTADLCASPAATLPSSTSWRAECPRDPATSTAASCSTALSMSVPEMLRPWRRASAEASNPAERAIAAPSSARSVAFRASSSSMRSTLEAATAAGHVLASELRACGVDLSFTPVLDLDHGGSGVIGDRAFHRDPRVVTALAKSLMHGLLEAGTAGARLPGTGAQRHLQGLGSLDQIAPEVGFPVAPGAVAG